MNILVTGGSGFIGSHTVDKLIEAGHKVRVLDLAQPHRKDIDFLPGNIISKGDVARALEDIEVVYHVAAFSNIDMVKDNPLTTVEHNILGTAYMLEECRKRGVRRFMFASSVYVYEEKGHLYTTSKLSSELICRNYYALFGLPYTILRYGTAYGPRSRGADVVSIFVKGALERNRITIFGTGEQSRHFIYVEDLAEGNVAALKEVAVNRVYDLAGPKPITIKQVVETVRRLVGDVTTEYEEARLRDYGGALAYDGKVKGELGWEPKVNLEEGIRRYIEWYKTNVHQKGQRNEDLLSR